VLTLLAAGGGRTAKQPSRRFKAYRKTA
jgi:hypothetical protein